MAKKKRNTVCQGNSGTSKLKKPSKSSVVDKTNLTEFREERGSVSSDSKKLTASSSSTKQRSRQSDRVLRSAKRLSTDLSVQQEFGSSSNTASFTAAATFDCSVKSSVPPKKRQRLTLEESQVNTGTCTSSATRRGSRSSVVGAYSCGAAPMASSNEQQQDPLATRDSDLPVVDNLLPPAPSSSSTTAATTSQRTTAASTLDSTSSGLGRFQVPPDSHAAVFFQCGIMDNTTPEDMQRLHQLLESNSFIGVQMHQLMASRMSSSSSQRAQQLLHNLQNARTDVDTQIRNLDELHQILLMGNEDILSGFPVKAAVPLLSQCLQSPNIQLSLLACQSMQCMMDRLPRSSSSIIDCLPILLEKMQPFEIIDVAEVALSAVELLSRRHGKSILAAGGVSACLMHIDFFMVDLQYKALSIVANCFQHLRNEDYHLVSDSLPLLTERLKQTDSRIVERVCTCFSRLVDSYHGETKILKNLAAQDLISNLQQLLMTVPPILSSSSFQSVLHMLTTMCCYCPDLAVVMLRLNMADTLRYLLIGNSGTSATTSKGATAVAEFFLNRSSAEVLEIVRLICELLPTLPRKQLFSINGTACLSCRLTNIGDSLVDWQWQDDRGSWHSYSRENCMLMEHAYQSNEQHEVPVTASGRLYLIDLSREEQINEETGNTRPIQRRASPSNGLSTAVDRVADSRIDVFTENNDLAQNLVGTLLNLLFDVFSESSGQMVRLACLQAILRMLYFTRPDVLIRTMNVQLISSQLATMLSSTDIRVVVCALQMSDILLDKMSDQVALSFRRQGLVYNLEKLMSGNHPLFDKQSKTNSVSLPSTPQVVTPTSCSTFSASDFHLHPSPASTGKLGDILRRKKSSGKSSFGKSGSPSSKLRELDDVSSSRVVTRSRDNSASTKMKSATGNTISVSPSNTSSSAASSGRLAAKAQSFLSTLAPRWGNSRNHASSAPASLNSRHSLMIQQSQELAKSTEQTKQWIKENAERIFVNYFSSPRSEQSNYREHTNHSDNSQQHHEVTLAKLKETSQLLHSNNSNAAVALSTISKLLVQSDLSSFELIHSDLVPNLWKYLICDGHDTNVQQFAHVFLGVSSDFGADKVPCGHALLSYLVTRLLSCLSQTEQFSVRVHDTKGGGSIMRYLNTHQLKCHLVRHPDCSSSVFSSSSGFEPSGPVKVDPLALVATVERYLCNRLDAGDSEEADTSDTDDEDMDDNRIRRQSVGRSRTRLQLLIGEHILPSNMTVFQAIRQYGQNHQQAGSSNSDDDFLASTNTLWSQTHTILYRPLTNTNTDGSPSFVNRMPTNKSHKGNRDSDCSGSRSRRKRWTEGVIPKPVSLLLTYLDADTLSSVSGVIEPCKSVLSLLNTLYGINKHLTWLYTSSYLELEPLLPLSDFLSAKLSSKVMRQLQDPLVVLTSQIPVWVSQLAAACPFLLSFEVRHLLLYVHSFDRDRAMLKLQEVAGDISAVGSDSSGGDSSRVAPKIEKKRRTVSRKDLLKVCDKLLEELASSKAVLEVSYENEAGTGLGPTLEFYSLVCKELCRSDLGIWRRCDTTDDGYLHTPCGLYPRPLPRTQSGISRIRNRFKMIGRLMAKAVVDSRKLDLPLSPVLYKWLLCQETSLCYMDLYNVDPDLARTWRQLAQVVNQKKQVENDLSHTSASRELALNALTMDGCSMEDLGLDFTLPGYPEVELLKGGKDMLVSIDNLEEYLNLVVYVTLVDSVQRQMEALLEGFETVFPISNLQLFYAGELEMVFCGGNPCQDSWDLSTLGEACRPDHGFTLESRAIKFLFQVMSEFGPNDRRQFLQFVTGSPRLPVGGWRSLNPPLTVVVKKMEGEQDADVFLPSATTCVNYLKLPDYSNIETMRAKLYLAMQEGQLAFHLS